MFIWSARGGHWLWPRGAEDHWFCRGGAQEWGDQWQRPAEACSFLKNAFPFLHSEFFFELLLPQERGEGASSKLWRSSLHLSAHPARCPGPTPSSSTCPTWAPSPSSSTCPTWASYESLLGSWQEAASANIPWLCYEGQCSLNTVIMIDEHIYKHWAAILSMKTL